MRRLLRGLLIAALLVYPCALLVAHVRLTHPTNGTALRWNSPSSVGIVIQADGSADVPDASDELALRLAIQEWNAVAGTTAALVEDTSAASQARTDYGSTDIHLILFDESNVSGYFGGTQIVALTPIWFNSSGVIVDADVLFNGVDFAFTTSGAATRFDVQDVATHELGHLLGLDHTGAAGGTMFPYVSRNVVLQRSLSQDELAGLRHAYPSAATGQITGAIERASNGSAVAGAYIVARDSSGRTRASILAATDGTFTLRGLEPGTYSVYARPLDAPVDEGNLGSYYTGKVDTDFEPAMYPVNATIAATETIALGTLAVGADVALSLGEPIDAFPLRAAAGTTTMMVLHGSGLVALSVLEASDPDLVLGTPVWSGSQVAFSVTVPPGEAPGHVDLTVVDPSTRIAILPAALEITPPSPTVTSVVPGQGSFAGGTALTLTGTGFSAGARVVIGEHVYTDGVDATVVDSGTLTLTTAATTAGLHDVVVIDGSGVEGRAVDGFHALSAPSIANVFPAAGDAAGGTEVVLAGEGFADPMLVRIDGLDQGTVTFDGPTQVRFTTVGGVPGGPYVLELENSDGAITSHSFSYVAQADPTIAAVTPSTGSTAGGTVITLTGSGFTPGTSVSFFADPAGTAVPAAAVTFVDPATLEVTTPPHGAGPASLLAAEASGSGAFARDAFTFTAGGGGGGGCYTVPLDEPRGPRALLEGSWWLVLVLAALLARARSTRLAAARA